MDFKSTILLLLLLLNNNNSLQCADDDINEEHIIIDDEPTLSEDVDDRTIRHTNRHQSTNVDTTTITHASLTNVVTIQFVTSMCPNAGTDANIYIALADRNNRRSKYVLLNNVLNDDFENGVKDTFEVRNT